MEEINNSLDFFGFHVVQNPQSTPCASAVLPSCRVLASAGEYSMDACTSIQVTLDPAECDSQRPFVIVPSTQDPSDSGSCKITVFSKVPFQVRRRAPPTTHHPSSSDSPALPLC